MTITSISYPNTCFLFIFLIIISISICDESKSIQENTKLIESYFNGTIPGPAIQYDDDLNIEFTITNIRIMMTYQNAAYTEDPSPARKYYNTNIYLLFDLHIRYYLTSIEFSMNDLLQNIYFNELTLKIFTDFTFSLPRPLKMDKYTLDIGPFKEISLLNYILSKNEGMIQYSNFQQWELYFDKILLDYPKSNAKKLFDYIFSYITSISYNTIKVVSCKKDFCFASVYNLAYNNYLKFGGSFGNFTNVTMDIYYENIETSETLPVEINYLIIAYNDISEFSFSETTSQLGMKLAEEIFKTITELYTPGIK